MLDDHAAGDYKIFVNLLTDKRTWQHGEFEPGTVLCFEVGVLGASRRANWYQYGYGRPQGPIPNKSVSGKDVRMMADFLYRRFELHARAKSLPATGTDRMDRRPITLNAMPTCHIRSA